MCALAAAVVGAPPRSYVVRGDDLAADGADQLLLGLATGFGVFQEQLGPLGRGPPAAPAAEGDPNRLEFATLLGKEILAQPGRAGRRGLRLLSGLLG